MDYVICRLYEPYQVSCVYKTVHTSVILAHILSALQRLKYNKYWYKDEIILLKRTQILQDKFSYIDTRIYSCRIIT